MVALAITAPERENSDSPLAIDTANRAKIGYSGLHHWHSTEEIMAKVKNIPTDKEAPAAVEQPKQPNHTAVIKSQVLARIGKPPRLDHVEVCKQHNGKYRVNIWEQTEPKKNIAVTPSPRIGLSYYLKVSDAGEIIDSNPPMTKVGTSVVA